MELTHSFTVPTTVEHAWATFMDIEGVATCFPGATVTDASADDFHGTVKVKLGPIALTYAGSGTFVERDDVARRAVIEAKGKDKRGNGTAGATVTITFTEEGERSTKADVGTDLTITGKPAQFGRGVIQDVSDKLLHQFISCIETRLAEGEAPAAGAAEETAPPAEGAGAAPSPEAAPTAGAAPAAEAADVASTGAVPEGERAAAPGPAGTRPVGAEADAGEAAAASGSAGRAAPAATSRPASTTRPEGTEALDLGATVVPILLRTYGPYVAVGVAGLVIGFVIGWAVGG